MVLLYTLANEPKVRNLQEKEIREELLTSSFTINEFNDRVNWFCKKHDITDLNTIGFSLETYDYDNYSEPVLMITGKRLETAPEHDKRVNDEIERKNLIERQQYNEYLRLKRMYDNT